jgi:ribosomal protein S27E
MIAHLVRRLVPPRYTQRVACPRCQRPTCTETHRVIYCLACGEPIPVPPVGAAA